MIDNKVIKFFIALIIVSSLVEIVRNIDNRAAITLASIIVLGIAINNPFALALISANASKLREE